MKNLLLITFLLFPCISQAQIEWTEFSLHVLSSNLDAREFCVNFPGEQTFELVEFDRLVEGQVIVNANDREVLSHSGESINAVQTYQIQFTTNRVCIQYSTNEDFWIRFQISKK